VQELWRNSLTEHLREAFIGKENEEVVEGSICKGPVWFRPGQLQ